MSIEKYLKDTPDQTYRDTAWASTDGENLKLYKLSNAGNNIGLEWCYSTNFNNTNFNGNAYIKTDVDSVETARTGITCPTISPLANGRYLLDFDDSAPAWNKIEGGFAFGVVFFNLSPSDFSFDNIYICPNLDYSRLVINTSAWDGSAGSGERRYLTDDSDKLCTDGYRLRLSSITQDNTIGVLDNLHIVIATIGDDGVPVIKLYGATGASNQWEAQIGSRWWQTGVIDGYKNVVHEYPYYSNINYRIRTMMVQQYNEKFRGIFTIPHTKQALMHEQVVWTSQYGQTYASSYFGSVDVQSWTRFMNATGLRYYDGEAFTDIDDIKENIYMGIMDKEGVTDCDSRIKGWDEIEASDLPNKDRNGYDWDIYDPTNPPAPEPDDDYDDDPWGKIEWGGAYFGAGNFTNLWYCTATDLDNLRRWMNGADTAHPLPEGFNPMNQILGLMQFPIGLGGTLTEELTMRTQANVTVHSGVMINKGFGDDLYYNLGSIDIPLRMKERGVPFLDYGSTIELYVPFCGVFQLDPQTVLGADIVVEMWLSPVTGECNCIVSVGRGENRGPVAFGSGNMASDIPVTANGYGLYAAAAKEASLKRNELMFGGLTQGVQSLSGGANVANTLAIGEQIAGESIAGAWGAVGAVAGGASAAIGAGIALAQATHNIHALDVGMQHVKNASGTSVSGSFSGTSAWHYPFQCYVKITRPRYRIPSNYAHTQGVPLIKTQSLSSCNGFTMCVGTDLSSVSATEVEKEQIAAFLSNGVIV